MNDFICWSDIFSKPRSVSRAGMQRLAWTANEGKILGYIVRVLERVHNRFLEHKKYLMKRLTGTLLRDEDRYTWLVRPRSHAMALRIVRTVPIAFSWCLGKGCNLLTRGPNRIRHLAQLSILDGQHRCARCMQQISITETLEAPTATGGPVCKNIDYAFYVLDFATAIDFS